MRTIFRFFRGILRMAWSLFWGFFWTIAISFLVLVGIIYFTDSPSSGMDGFGRAAQKVVYQVGNLFGDQGFASRFGMTPSSQTTQTDNHEHRLPKRLSIKSAIYLVIRALHRALGWRLAHRPRRRTIMSIVALAGKKRRLRSIWIPISVKLL